MSRERKHNVRNRTGQAAWVVLASALWILLAATGCNKQATHEPPSDGGTPPSAEACTGPAFGLPLVQPRTIRPGAGNVVDTTLVVRKEQHCVPYWDDTEPAEWKWQEMSLRSYGSPADGNNPNDPNLEWTIPGPTYRINKAYLQETTAPPSGQNPEVKTGTRFKLLLRNELANNPLPAHDCDPATVQQPPLPGRQPGDPFEEFNEDSPECFHGADVTNIHYHGTHVSPQPHQDFVLLSLYSSNQTDPAPPPVSETVAHGSYQTDINPFPWNQAPGTHWYHPHKHGSTALQVLNGLSGGLIIEGPFDDWLYEFYGVDSTNQVQLEIFEKVLVLQQVWEDLVFYQRPHPNYPPEILINGQAEPDITMQPGEVQRWRFIGATMQAAATLKLYFPAGFEVKQIAQDGVQFDPVNYERQPLYPAGEGGSSDYILAPGNRADFLVKAPTVAAETRYFLTHDVLGNLTGEALTTIDKRAIQRRVATEKLHGKVLGQESGGESVLIQVTVKGTGEDKAKSIDEGMPLPNSAQFPPMPYYLRGIESSEIVRSRTVPFSMTPPGGAATGPGVQKNSFWINDRQYDASCSEYTMSEGTGETWVVTNDSSPQHPFHIHINPFQVVRDDTREFTAPFIWQDTISLPAGAPGAAKSVELRQRFEDYTGGYVIHCHFLGHEDRGMMVNVQTVCPEGTPDSWQYGMPQAAGGADDCTVPSATPALPSCSGAF
jgi:FtsP/CotA-like multicopper oxidase with cupredoxin domain